MKDGDGEESEGQQDEAADLAAALELERGVAGGRWSWVCDSGQPFFVDDSAAGGFGLEGSREIAGGMDSLLLVLDLLCLC